MWLRKGCGVLRVSQTFDHVTKASDFSVSEFDVAGCGCF